MRRISSTISSAIVRSNFMKRKFVIFLLLSSATFFEIRRVERGKTRSRDHS